MLIYPSGRLLPGRTLRRRFLALRRLRLTSFDSIAGYSLKSKLCVTICRGANFLKVKSTPSPSPSLRVVTMLTPSAENKCVCCPDKKVATCSATKSLSCVAGWTVVSGKCVVVPRTCSPGSYLSSKLIPAGRGVRTVSESAPRQGTRARSARSLTSSSAPRTPSSAASLGSRSSREPARSP